MYGNCYIIDILTIAVKYAGQDILARIGQSALCRLAFLNCIVETCYIMKVSTMWLLCWFWHCEESQSLSKMAVSYIFSLFEMGIRKEVYMRCAGKRRDKLMR